MYWEDLVEELMKLIKNDPNLLEYYKKFQEKYIDILQEIRFLRGIPAPVGTDWHQKAPIGTGITPELHQVSLFKRFLMCYIYNGQSAGQEPRSRVHFLLQKNTGNDERLFMIAERL